MMRALDKALFRRAGPKGSISAIFVTLSSGLVFLPRLSGWTLPQQLQRLIKGGRCAKLHPRLEKW